MSSIHFCTLALGRQVSLSAARVSPMRCACSTLGPARRLPNATSGAPSCAAAARGLWGDPPIEMLRGKKKRPQLLGGGWGPWDAPAGRGLSGGAQSPIRPLATGS